MADVPQLEKLLSVPLSFHAVPGFTSLQFSGSSGGSTEEQCCFAALYICWWVLGSSMELHQYLGYSWHEVPSSKPASKFCFLLGLWYLPQGIRWNTRHFCMSSLQRIRPFQTNGRGDECLYRYKHLIQVTGFLAFGENTSGNVLGNLQHLGSGAELSPQLLGVCFGFVVHRGKWIQRNWRSLYKHSESSLDRIYRYKYICVCIHICILTYIVYQARMMSLQPRCLGNDSSCQQQWDSNRKHQVGLRLQ